MRRNYAFLDTETSGLDPDRHGVLEVGVYVVTPEFQFVRQYEALINPDSYSHCDIDPEAMAVNGLSLARLRGEGRSARAVALELGEILSETAVCGHSVTFDWEMLRGMFRRAQAPVPVVDYQKLDTKSLMWPLKEQGLVKSLKLSDAAAALGLDRTVEHRALADAKRSCQLAQVLLRGLKFEGPARSRLGERPMGRVAGIGR